MKGKGYTVYSIITVLLEEAGLAIAIIWLLPEFGIEISLWVLVLLMVALGAWSFIAYRLGKKALDKEAPSPTQAMVGCKGIATMPLDTEGIIQIRGELWKARASSAIDKDKEVVVVGIEGLTLLVTPLPESNHGANEDAPYH